MIVFFVIIIVQGGFYMSNYIDSDDYEIEKKLAKKRELREAKQRKKKIRLMDIVYLLVILILNIRLQDLETC